MCDTGERSTYYIRTSKERLILSIVLALEFAPVLHLNCRIRACGDTFQVVLQLVALVSRIHLRDVGYHLVVYKVCLRAGICPIVSPILCSRNALRISPFTKR